MIRVLLVDDHKMFTDGLKSMLEGNPRLQIIECVDNAEQVLETIEKTYIEVVLLDINLPGKNGLDIVPDIKQKHPKVNIIMLSMHDEPKFINTAIEAGVNGYLLKNSTIKEVVQAVETVQNGGSFFSNQVAQSLINQKHHQSAGFIELSSRELEVLEQVCNEKTNEEIAKALFISVNTVKTHRRHLLDKLGVKNTVGLVKYAYENGLIG